MHLMESEGVTVLPWMPAGADLNPLDIFVNDSVKNALKGKDVGTRRPLSGPALK